jgi:diadenosine tetraphosphate (Ap4A) HIT family hydrolase
MPENLQVYRRYCDDSGLCEEIDEVSNSTRLVRSGRVAVLLVDISPMTMGHCLVATRKHIPRSAILGWDDYCELQRFIGESRTAMFTALRQNTLLIEHGAADGHSLWDCVCHAHIHVVPMRDAEVVPRIASVIPKYMSDVVVFSQNDLGAIREYLLGLPEYLTLTVCGSMWIGAPQPGIRHGSRYLIADLCGLGEETVDWGVVPRGRLFTESLSSLNSSHESYV